MGWSGREGRSSLGNSFGGFEGGKRNNTHLHNIFLGRDRFQVAASGPPQEGRKMILRSRRKRHRDAKSRTPGPTAGKWWTTGLDTPRLLLTGLSYWPTDRRPVSDRVRYVGRAEPD